MPDDNEDAVHVVAANRYRTGQDLAGNRQMDAPRPRRWLVVYHDHVIGHFDPIVEIALQFSDHLAGALDGFCGTVATDDCPSLSHDQDAEPGVQMAGAGFDQLSQGSFNPAHVMDLLFSETDQVQLFVTSSHCACHPSNCQVPTPAPIIVRGELDKIPTAAPGRRPPTFEKRRARRGAMILFGTYPHSIKDED